MPQGQPELSWLSPEGIAAALSATLQPKRGLHTRTRSRLCQFDAGHVSTTLTLEQFVQAPVSILPGGREIIEERVAGGPPPLRRAQDNYRTTAIDGRQQTTPVALWPRGGDQIHRFAARYTQGDKRIYGRIEFGANNGRKIPVAKSIV